MKAKKTIISFILILGIMLLSTCFIPNPGDNPYSEDMGSSDGGGTGAGNRGGTGTVNITLPGTTVNRSLWTGATPTDAFLSNYVSYVVHMVNNGNHVGGSPITVTPFDGRVVSRNVPLGLLVVNVYATINGFDYALGTGNTNVVVGQNNNIPINMRRYDYGVVLRGFTRDSAGVYHFSRRLPGYSTNNIPELNVHIYNFAENATGPLAVTITGPFNSSGVSTINSIARDVRDDTLIVKPNDNLPQGVHTGAVRVHGGNGINVSFPVRFAVTPDAIATVPDVPLNFTATPGNTQVTLSWDAPANDGGDVIIGYEVSRDNGVNWISPNPVTATTHTFTGLTNGTTYTFWVRAINAEGPGPHASHTATLPVPVASVLIAGTTTYHSTLQAALNSIQAGTGTITLLTDISNQAPIPLTRTSATTINLESPAGPPRTITLGSIGSLFTVGNNVTLNIGSATSGPITLNGRTSNNAPLIGIMGGGTLNLNTNATLTGNNNSGSPANGGGVVVSINGTFNMNGGTIQGNSASGNGGGVHVENGIFNMTGGTIGGTGAAANTALRGGGVHIIGGTFTMSGGTIQENTATSIGDTGGTGGGVHVGNGTFNMTGGTLGGNTASVTGGGVHVANGAIEFFHMGGEARITVNNANNNNDVFLAAGRMINITNDFTAGGQVARITPNAYPPPDRQVLSGNVTGGTPANHTRFTVTPQQPGNIQWVVNSQGRLSP
ncbi:MAG: fibronectin type III domain-containing protein [Spirochaetaceae bacterium]|nr:fibronectin type III domain-containing protein [Spirochaetaceae bacterium]